MSSIAEVKETLAQRSETTSLEELQSRGRKKLRVIRPEHIAAMIDEAVQRAVSDSDHLSQEQADELVAKSREEFKAVVAERQADAKRLQDAETKLADAEARIIELDSELQSAVDNDGLDEAQQRIAELEQQLIEAQASAQAQSQTNDGTADLLLKMFEKMSPQQAAAQAPADAGGLDTALDKLSSAMNDRLDKMSRKMGISTAVEGDSVKLDALFNDLDEAEIESNLDDMEVKQKTSGGIADNLARLKKLKGGGAS